VNFDEDMTETPALQPLLGDWPSAALSCLEREPCVVRVIVASVRGSAPREPGACMLVGSQSVVGTIGGGNLEREAIAAARLQMSEPSGNEPRHIERRDLETRDLGPIRICRMTLGRDLAQCCGGVVELWLERLTREDRSWLTSAATAARAGYALLVTRATRGVPDRSCLTAKASERLKQIGFELRGPIRFGADEHGLPTLRERIDAPAAPLWLYGAGHVGRAVVRGLAELPFDVTWVDSRRALLAGGVPPNTRTLHTADPASLTGRAPSSAYHLVMTHDHGLDFDICHAILRRGEFAWLGLIGSASKAAKFRARLARERVASERIARLVCPIGVGGLTSKLPAAIAASVTVQLLQELEHAAERALFHPAPHADCPAEDCESCHARQGVFR
jgi:xanthine dehydrogenase accessory factor